MRHYRHIDGNCRSLHPLRAISKVGLGTCDSHRKVSAHRFNCVPATPGPAARVATTPNATHTQLTYGDFNNDGVIDIATNANAVSYSLQLSNTSETTTAQTFNLNTADGARAAISQIDATLDRIRAELGDIGSYQSRLQSSLNSLSSLADNFQAAASRITDVDVAHESANLVRQ